MSPLRMGAAQAPRVTPEELDERVTALRQALLAGGSELDPYETAIATTTLDKVGSRTAIAGNHTVVALAGATGSGKSSLFNALTATDLAVVGARRPTTSTPVAAIWGDEPAAELLDWLGVNARHHVDAEGPAGSGPFGTMDGLVLLDLPDFDSRVQAHRDEAARILALVDLFVWVTDPQKYADARLHDDHLAVLKAHDANTIVVLNQADRLTRDQLRICTEDLTRLAERDGLVRPQILSTSTVTGSGLDELRQRLANAVAAMGLSRHRLAADVRASVNALEGSVADGEPTVDADTRREVVSALAVAAGVPVVVEAVDRDYRREAGAQVGWLFTRWAGRLRPDPLKRLRLERKDLRGMTRGEVRHVLGRSSLPKATPAARAGVDLATDRLCVRAGVGLPVRWSHAVASAAQPDESDLTDALDQAVTGTSLRFRNPRWWTVMGLLQLLLGVLAVVGLVWLAALFVVDWFRLPEPPGVSVGPVPLPSVLAIGGLVLGLLLAWVSRPLVAVGARRRAGTVSDRMAESIGVVADTHLLGPVQDVLDRHRRTREQLAVASG